AALFDGDLVVAAHAHRELSTRETGDPEGLIEQFARPAEHRTDHLLVIDEGGHRHEPEDAEPGKPADGGYVIESPVRLEAALGGFARDVDLDQPVDRPAERDCLTADPLSQAHRIDRVDEIGDLDRLTYLV